MSDAQRTKYLRLWAGAGGGEELGGDACRGVFVKSKLGFSVLGRVW